MHLNTVKSVECVCSQLGFDSTQTVLVYLYIVCGELGHRKMLSALPRSCSRSDGVEDTRAHVAHSSSHSSHLTAGTCCDLCAGHTTNADDELKS